MTQQITFKIVVVGSGFAANQCALALSQQLPNSVALTFIQTSPSNEYDFLYGSLSSPTAYQNNLKLQVSEPDIMLKTRSTFSFGTGFTNWGKNKCNWMQCFHLPFPVEAGVGFQHFMTRHKAQLSDYLISAQAALMGRFAHPPESKPSSALSRAEYGYHFDPQEWAALYFSKLNKTSVNVINAGVDSVETANDNISVLHLTNGQKIEANLFVDCTGVEGLLVNRLDKRFDIQRNVTFEHQLIDTAETGPAYRQLSANNLAWEMRTPLQGQDYVLQMRDNKLTQNAGDQKHNHGVNIQLGRKPNAWVGNCVAIGNSAYTMESVTPAPYMLLCKDIERLLELIPVTTNMHMESKEYNRRYNNDVKHAELFQHAIYEQHDNSPYPCNDMLNRKLTQFGHRGVLANYDLEPFNDEDWLILHLGMGRRPKRYYEMADQVGMAQMSAKLEHMRKGIAHLASQMPTHHIYLQKFLQFLRKNHANK